MTYPLKFRQHVLGVQEREGLTFEQTSQRFRIGKTSLVRWHKKVEPAKNRNKAPTKISMEALAEDVKRYPDAYQYERASRLGVSKNCVHYALKRLGITFKKRVSNIQKLITKLEQLSKPRSSNTSNWENR
jgi:transposase